MAKKHSTAFVQEMKIKLEQEKQDLEKQLQNIARKTGGGDYQANFPEYGRNEEDNATEIGDYTSTASTETALEARLQSIESALQRIKEGTYGITSEGEIVPEERLRANPAATTIIKTS